MAQPSLTAGARIALACLDLTSLNDDDSEASVAALCTRAAGAFGPVAAVCVWPRFAALARRLAPAAVRVAAVANFPAGTTDLERTTGDVASIVDAGAQEVDVVLPWRALLAGDEVVCAAVVRAARRACRGLTLKVILESGELHDDARIAAASQIALAEGADFLKTSTGKTPRGATPQAAAVMLRAIAGSSGQGNVGLKVSGGIRRVADAAPYIDAVAAALGRAALAPARFRIGASSLLADIEAVLAGAAPPRGGDGNY